MRILDKQLLCGCYLFDTIANQIISPNYNVKFETPNMHQDILSALHDLESFLIQLRSITAIRQSLGLILPIPNSKRWTTLLAIIDCFTTNATQIGDVIQEHRPELLTTLYEKFEEKRTIFAAFQQLFKPLKIRIKKLEVS